MATTSVTPAAKRSRRPRKPKVNWGIVIDSREQAPYDFAVQFTDSPRYSPPIRLGIPSGDYTIYSWTEFCHDCGGDGSVMGIECTSCHGSKVALNTWADRVAVERKSLSDLYGSTGHDRERFQREIQLLNDLEFAAVVIEATMLEVCRPSTTGEQWYSEMQPKSVYGTIVSWGQRYPRVHWYFAESRAYGELTVFTILETFFRHAMEARRDEPSN